jgi:hypothetical protein
MQFNYVITLPQSLATAKIRAASTRTLLLEDAIHAFGLKRTQQEIRGIKSIPQQDVTTFQGIEQGSK